MKLKKHLSIGETAELFGTQAWRVARLFEGKALPEPARIAGRRVIPIESLPEIAEQLRLRGWLVKPPQEGLT